MSNQSIFTGLLAGILGALLVLGMQHFTKPATIEGTTDIADEFGTNVREYLIANPEVIIEALQKHQENQQQVQLDAARDLIRSESAAIFTNPASPVLGNPSGNVSMVEFFDYNCGYCRHNAPVVEELKESDSNIRIIHKHLPILGPESLEATKVALAARMQSPEIYEKLSKAFLSAEGKLNSTGIEKLAREAGANWEKILVDKESADIQAEIKANYDLAQKLKLSGTPGFIVGDQLMPGAQTLDALKKAVADARSAQAGNASTQAPAAAEATPEEPQAVAPEAAPEAPAEPAAE